MAEWDGNESSCSCDCGFDIPKGGTLNKLKLNEPLAPEYGGTGVISIDELRNLIGIGKIQSGTIDAMGNTAGGSYRDGSHEFQTPFSNPPTVVIGFVSTSSAAAFGKCSVAVVDVTKTGFTFRFFNGDDSNRNPKFNWIASE